MTATALPRTTQPHSDWLAKLRTVGLGLGGRGVMGVGLGRSAWSAAAGVDWSQWFDHVWVAKGAASLAASYTDLVGTKNLSTSAAPGFDTSYGWSMNGSSNYLDTGLLWDAGTWSILLAFTDYLGGTTFAGVNNSGMLRIHKQGLTSRNYNNKYAALTNTVSSHSAGVMGLAGSTAYFNGSSDGTLTGDTGSVEYFTIFIGARNNGGFAGNFVNAKMQAVGIKKATLDAAQMAAASAAMAAL